MGAVIHHNPKCGTSRNVLAFLKASSDDVTVIEFLETGWTRPQLLALFAVADMSPRDALRTNHGRAEEMGLLEEGVTDDQIIDAMLDNPVLVNRPIVATPKGVRLCRPAEKVFEIIETMPAGPLHKENGNLVIDENGNLV